VPEIPPIRATDCCGCPSFPGALCPPCARANGHPCAPVESIDVNVDPENQFPKIEPLPARWTPPPAAGFLPGSCTECGAHMLIRAGACAVCANCGTTTGCS